MAGRRGTLMMMMMMMISNLVDEVVGSREEGHMDGDEVGVGEKSLHGHVLPVLYRLQGGAHMLFSINQSNWHMLFLINQPNRQTYCSQPLSHYNQLLKQANILYSTTLTLQSIN